MRRKFAVLCMAMIAMAVAVVSTPGPAMALCGFGYQTCNWFCAQEAEREWQACGREYGQFLQECSDRAQEVYDECAFDCTMYYCGGYPPV